MKMKRVLWGLIPTCLLFASSCATADPVSEAKAWLIAGKPLIFVMDKTVGTLKAGQKYIVGYQLDGRSGAQQFDTQGPSGGSNDLDLARYSNGNLQGLGTAISLWGTVEYLTNRYGRLVLYPTRNPQLWRIPDATIWQTPLSTQALADADAAYKKKLGLQPAHSCFGLTGDAYLKCYYTTSVPGYCKSAMDCIDAAGTPTCIDNICSTVLACSTLHGPTYSNALVRAISDDLEGFAKYHPFVYNEETWNSNASVMSTLYAYLHEAINTTAPYGFRSSYNCDNQVSGTDPQTPAYMIRALYAYWQATRSATAHLDFVRLSEKWLADFKADPILGFAVKLYPNDRGTLSWVVARRLAETLEQPSVVGQLCSPVLMTGLYEQYTAPSQFSCLPGVPRGFGGWSHASASVLQTQATSANCAPFQAQVTQTGTMCSLCKDGTNACLSPEAKVFADAYKQHMGYHLMVVRGFSELYRVMQATGNMQCRDFVVNYPYNAMASISWVYSLRMPSVFSDPGTTILDVYTNPCIDGPTPGPNYGMYGTTVGLTALYEVQRTIDVAAYLPYQQGFGPTPTFSASDLNSMISDVIRFNDAKFFDAVLYYSDRLQFEFPTLRPSLF